MTLLVIDRSDVELECEGNALVVREGGRRTTLPLRQVTRAVLQGAGMRLQLSVLQKLAENGATTVLLSARRTRRVALVLGNAHNDARLRLSQAMKVVDVDYCLEWSRIIVAAKLQRQARLVHEWVHARPDARFELVHAHRGLMGLSGKPELAQDVDALRGIEGAGARMHFQALSCVVPPSLGFTGRNRRPPRDPLNAALSLGYTLLHTEAVHALHAAGLDPLLGFYHRPAFGRESLASDLIEPLRPAVDRWLWRLFAGRVLREDHFTLDGEACLLGKAGRGVFFAAWAEYRSFPARWLARASRRLANNLAASGAMPFDGAEESWDEA
jgi:CRISPR-associated protein Cas1